MSSVLAVNVAKMAAKAAVARPHDVPQKPLKSDRNTGASGCNSAEGRGNPFVLLFSLILNGFGYAIAHQAGTIYTDEKNRNGTPKKVYFKAEAGWL